MSIHINDSLSNLGTSSTLIIPTNFNTNNRGSIDLLSNIGSNETINISSQELLLANLNTGTTSATGATSGSASTIIGSELDNATLVRILDTELFPAENKRGGAPDTFLKYDDVRKSLR